MLKFKFKKFYYLILMVILMIFSITNFSLAKEIDSVGIENSIRAEANTGGNKNGGEDLIETGDASVSINSRNFINGEESKVKAEIKANVNDGEISIKVIDPGKIEIIENDNCGNNLDNSCSISIKNHDNYFNENFQQKEKVRLGFFEGIFNLFHKMIQRFKT